MDLTLSSEQQLLQETIRRIVSNEFLPLEQAHGDRRLPAEIRRHLSAIVSSMGIEAPTTPAEIGGNGLSALDLGLFLEETGRSILEDCTGASTLVDGDPPLPYLVARSDQGDHVVKSAIESGKRIAAAPPALGEMGTVTITSSGGDFVLNGLLPRVEQWHDCHSVLVFATLTDEPIFLSISPSSPGLSLLEEVPSDGRIGESSVTLRFENCRVSKELRVGSEGGGATIHDQWLAVESLKTCARLGGLVDRAARAARDYAKQRVTFGQPLSNRQAIQWKIVDTEIDLIASRWMVRRALAERDETGGSSASAARVRLYVLPALWRGIDESLQIFGGVGFTRDLPIESMWRHVRFQLDRYGSRRENQRAVFGSLLA